MALPSGYKQLEYIEATGNQWVDTGFTPNQDTRIVLDFAATTLTVTDGVKSNCLVGSRENTSSRAFALNITTEGYYRFGYNKSSPTTTVAADTNRHTADMNKNVLSLDGAVIYTATYATFSGYASVYIGQIHATNRNYYKGYVRIYDCQIYDNGTLVRDFVPCSNASGTVGMWDNVNGVFYENAGTGAFIAGPEVETDPMAPHDGHNTNIGNVAREIESGTVLIGGTSREIESGTVLVNGVVREIEISSSGEIEFYIEELYSGDTYTRYASEGMTFDDLMGNSTYDPDEEFMRANSIIGFKPKGTKDAMPLLASASWTAEFVKPTDTIIAGHTYGTYAE